MLIGAVRVKVHMAVAMTLETGMDGCAEAALDLGEMPAFVGVGSLGGYDCTKCISFYPSDQHRDGAGLSYLRLVVGGVNVHHPRIRLTIAKT